MTDETLLPVNDWDWLRKQLRAWPTRVNPERTINVEFLMKQAVLRIEMLEDALLRIEDMRPATQECSTAHAMAAEAVYALTGENR